MAIRTTITCITCFIHVDKYGSGYNGINVGKVRKVDFTAGATFVLNTILLEEMGKFAEWLDYNPYVLLKNGHWENCKKDEEITVTELVNRFKNRDNG